MAFRLFSVPMAVFFAWAAAMQLNDPDPERWFLMYASVAVLAGLSAMGRAAPRLALALALLALGWAAAIAPELWHHWTVRDLGAQMSAARPEVEFGREFVGLLILAAYCLAATRFVSRAPASAPKRPVNA
jgi:hypothetical protein